MNALANGERQVAPDLSGIRRDHLARYEFASAVLPTSARVLDLACGVGYGSHVLASAGRSVLGIDRSAEAIEFARAHYATSGARFIAGDAARLVFERDEFDACVCFETIEHLADPLPMLRALHRAAPKLIASVPNEAVFPYRTTENGFQGWAWHHRHYTRTEFGDLLAAAGWTVTDWLGQAGRESDVEPGVDGRTLIAVAERGPEPAIAEPSAVIEVEHDIPAHVSIVALGPSGMTFFELVRGLGGASAYCDEVWGVNALGDTFRCDRVFHMDDMLVQEARAAARPDSNIAAMVRWLKRHPGPIYTSIPRPGYPGMVAFPLEEVLNGNLDHNGGVPYFNSTVAYAIAYAIHIGVKRISLFGVDYTMPNRHHAEQGRACCEFWLGVAAARGIEITVPDTSSLLDACAPDRERLYGYDCVDVAIDPREEGGVSVRFTDRPSPSAEEIEARYDHSRHPNRLMDKEH